MKLRWVERKIRISTGFDIQSNQETWYMDKVTVLQYWGFVEGSKWQHSGEWVDVPLEVEE